MITSKDTKETEFIYISVGYTINCPLVTSYVFEKIATRFGNISVHNGN